MSSKCLKPIVAMNFLIVSSTATLKKTYFYPALSSDEHYDWQYIFLVWIITYVTNIKLFSEPNIFEQSKTKIWISCSSEMYPIFLAMKHNSLNVLWTANIERKVRSQEVPSNVLKRLVSLGDKGGNWEEESFKTVILLWQALHHLATTS